MVGAIPPVLKMKFYILFIIVRILDLAATYTYVAEHGVTSEGNPIQRFFMSGFTVSIVYNILAAVLVIWLAEKFRLVKKALKAVIVINMIVVVSNFLLLLN